MTFHQAAIIFLLGFASGAAVVALVGWLMITAAQLRALT